MSDDVKRYSIESPDPQAWGWDFREVESPKGSWVRYDDHATRLADVETDAQAWDALVSIDPECCPQCSSPLVERAEKPSEIEYGIGDDAMTIPYRAIVWSCRNGCDFSWEGWESEIVRDLAVEKALSDRKLAAVEQQLREKDEKVHAYRVAFEEELSGAIDRAEQAEANLAAALDECRKAGERQAEAESRESALKLNLGETLETLEQAEKTLASRDAEARRQARTIDELHTQLLEMRSQETEERLVWKPRAEKAEAELEKAQGDYWAARRGRAEAEATVAERTKERDRWEEAFRTVDRLYEEQTQNATVQNDKLEAAESRLREVSAMHKRAIEGRSGRIYCTYCSGMWPCKTMKILAPPQSPPDGEGEEN